MTLMQAPRMAAAAPQDTAPAPSMSAAKLKRVLWWFAALGLIGLAIFMGWGSKIDNSTNALKTAMTFANTDDKIPKRLAWNLSIDGAIATTSHATNTTTSVLRSAEARLIAIYQLLRSGERAMALSEARDLTSDYPNFQLAQLLYADLLAASANQTIDLSDLAPKNSEQATQLAALVRESELRLQALTEVPAPGTLPSNFVVLPPSTRNAIAIDASRARLYWFKNIAKPGEPAQMVLTKDAYMSVGKEGVGKFVEGDNRTPLGVYFITSLLPGSELPDLYGNGALPLNYPNALDILRKKTGSGIWLHGTPTEQYARAPLASEGCVVLSNPDISLLLEEADIMETPVVIAKSLTWVSAAAISAQLATQSESATAVNPKGTATDDAAASFKDQFANWQNNRRAQDFAALRNMYSDQFFRRGKGLSHWWGTIKNEATTTSSQDDITVLSWQDQDQVMVVNYSDSVTPNLRAIKKRQYWRFEGDTWRIFYEGNA
jgi:L,D-transpeptidase YnhG